MTTGIQQTGRQKVVIAGGGFGGLALARSLAGTEFEVTLIDRFNYHQFQPLFYQVATSGLEAASISFPFRKIIQKHHNIHFRVAEVLSFNSDDQTVTATTGILPYDHLVLATGVDTNFFGMEQLRSHAWPMKSLTEALNLRNHILQNFEDALSEKDEQEKQSLLNILVAGGGATGVEISGALAEMKKFVFPKDYPELDCTRINIFLSEASPGIMGTMSEGASRKSADFLKKMGVTVMTGCRVKSYDGEVATLEDGRQIRTRTLIWAAGIRGVFPEGINPEVITRGGRIKVDRYNRVEGYQNIYALGDLAWMTEEKYPEGHPQVAPVAIQMARNLGRNLKYKARGRAPRPFRYFNMGAMATVGRNKAVVDLKYLRFRGMFAWFVWMFVHLMSIVGVKNRLFIFINWFWSYITYDQSLRLIIRTK